MPEPDVPPVVLASASAVRHRLLSGAGVPHMVDPARIDEDEVKRALAAENAPPAAVAETLAEFKALSVARRDTGALVIGADQVLDCGGVLFDKPADRDQASAHLRALRGRRHSLFAGLCVVRDGRRLWHHNDRADMDVRAFGEGFVEHYLDEVGDAALDSVGAYQLEGLGAQLFSRVRGDYFTVLGLPLLPLLDFLRAQRVVPA